MLHNTLPVSSKKGVKKVKSKLQVERGVGGPALIVANFFLPRAIPGYLFLP